MPKFLHGIWTAVSASIDQGILKGSHVVLSVSTKASICIDLYQQIPSAGEATHRLDLVQRILHGRDRQQDLLDKALDSIEGVSQRSSK
jgi:hypothetical protein